MEPNQTRQLYECTYTSVAKFFDESNNIKKLNKWEMYSTVIIIICVQRLLKQRARRRKKRH